MGSDSDAIVRVGVTGHRSLDDEPAVVDGVDAVLDRIADRWPGRSLEVRSALADGADRLVAARVLARPGARLVAVLPLPVDEYVVDFETAEARADFERLLAAAIRVEVAGPDAGGTRESAYERAGREVVDGSDVVIALWDGEASQGRGGTAEIVAYALDRAVDVEVVRVSRAAS